MQFTRHPTIRPEPFWRLLYRYLWPFQYFRDVTRGTRLERQQNYRHNRAMRSYLPGFMLKWTILTVLSFGFGGMLDGLMNLAVPAAGCFITGSWTMVVVVLLAVSWLWLERFPELL